MDLLAFYSPVFTLGCSRILSVENTILDLKPVGDILEETQKPFSWKISGQTMSLITLVE